MGYAAFKQGKPKKKIVPAESSENSISFETVVDSAERLGESENSSVNLLKNSTENSIENLTGFLLTEADVEDAFSDLMGITKTADKDERAAVDITADARTVSRTPEQITGKPHEQITAEVEKIGRENFILQNQNSSLDRKENLSQLNLFS